MKEFVKWFKKHRGLLEIILTGVISIGGIVVFIICMNEASKQQVIENAKYSHTTGTDTAVVIRHDWDYSNETIIQVRGERFSTSHNKLYVAGDSVLVSVDSVFYEEMWKYNNYEILKVLK